jgi:hypothetical protein
MRAKSIEAPDLVTLENATEPHHKGLDGARPGLCYRPWLNHQDRTFRPSIEGFVLFDLPPLFYPAPYRRDWTSDLTDHRFRNAPQQQVAHSCASVGAHDNEVNPLFLRQPYDGICRLPDHNFDLNWETMVQMLRGKVL